MTEKKKGLARGLTNYGDPAFSLYLRRSFAKSMGYSSEMLARPVVGIAQSRRGRGGGPPARRVAVDTAPPHPREWRGGVKRGVLAGGGLPIDFPTVSLGEV